ncbi:MAG: translation initiation factor IF-3 [Verrucomicrobia subdivision 3 bacterium]|nr:translation initiation factor IF-3 [Limisphaerales bacterium]
MNRPFRSFQPREPKHRRNGKIRAREVRVLDEARQQLGVMSLNDALRLAQSKGLDLIEVVPNAVPPVCRIGEYGKLLYEESKRNKDAESPGSKMKEIQLTPGIEAHDFTTKLNHAIEFLSAGMKVHVKLRFRGRQRAHKEFGFQTVNRFVAAAAAYGRADSPPKMLGDRDLNVVVSPLPRDKRGKSPGPKTPNQPPESPQPPPT